jgi:hypothetical protein
VTNHQSLPQPVNQSAYTSGQTVNLSTQALTPQISSLPFDEQHPRQPYQGPKPAVLLILDGWGIGPNNPGNAIAQAKTTNMDKYWLTFPHSQLGASGEAVGLPEIKMVIQKQDISSSARVT